MARKNRPIERAIRERTKAQHAFADEAVEQRLRYISKSVPASEATLRKVNSFGPVRTAELKAIEALKASQCCTPFPYAVFRRESLQSVVYMHRGLRCFGDRLEVSVGAWRAA